MPEFPDLNQREMAAFLGIDPKRLERATNAGIVARSGGFYPVATVTAQWLAYERSQNSRSKRRSELERQKARLPRVKAEIAERNLAALEQKWVDSESVGETLRVVCFRIRTKFQSALARLARGCYYAQSLVESNHRARAEFDTLMAELSALKGSDLADMETGFEIVEDTGDDQSASQAEV
jgi:hypothetical protein